MQGIIGPIGERGYTGKPGPRGIVGQKGEIILVNTLCIQTI